MGLFRSGSASLNSGRCFSVFSGERRFKWAAPVFFLAVLLLGILLNGDYGVSWDEFAERRSGALSAYCALNLLERGEVIPLSVLRQAIGGDCYYGMGFQHILFAAEHFLLGENDFLESIPGRDAWLMRHALNFMFVWCGLIALFLSGKLLWRRTSTALIPVLLFLLTPRFWAEAFYNSKDMPLLASVMIAGYFLLRMIRRPRIANAVLFAVAAAFAASIRLLGGAVFLAGAAAMIAAPRLRATQKITLLALIGAVAAAALIAFYPACWSAPADFFVEALHYMARHPWNGRILFFGREYFASQVPWYYVPAWMAVTLPVPLLALFLCGHCRAGKSFAGVFRGRRPFRDRCRILLALFFYISLLTIMFECGTCYNSWRQFYFLAWPVLLIAADGWDWLWRAAKRRRAAAFGCAAAAAVWIGCTAAWMVYVHPWQNMFFNVLAGAPDGRFELDYWHVAEMDALRRISARAADSDEVFSVARSETNYFVIGMLPPGERSRLYIVPKEEFCRSFVYFAPPQWRMEQGGRPFPESPQSPTGVRVLCEKNVRSSLFLHPVFLYRIYEFFSTSGTDR